MEFWFIRKINIVKGFKDNQNYKGNINRLWRLERIRAPLQQSSDALKILYDEDILKGRISL